MIDIYGVHAEKMNNISGIPKNIIVETKNARNTFNAAKTN